MNKCYAKDVITIANKYVGYLEKKSNKQLEDFKANVGDKNYTIFAEKFKELTGINNQGFAWCDMYVDTIFAEAFGKTNAQRLLGGFSAYTPTSAGYFQKLKEWYTNKPKIGDIIFFKNTSRICHTGIVYKVSNTMVYTIEGNTSSGSSVIPNGGAVCKKSYFLTNSRIAGYGRPKYDIEETTITPSTLNTWTKRLQKTIGAEVDGIAGKETLSKCPTIKLGSKGDVAKLLQEKLGVTADGEIGNVSLKAIKKWQKKNKLSADGIFNQDSWKKLLGL